MKDYNRYTKDELINAIMKNFDGLGYSREWWKSQTKQYLIKAIMFNR